MFGKKIVQDVAVWSRVYSSQIEPSVVLSSLVQSVEHACIRFPAVVVVLAEYWNPLVFFFQEMFPSDRR